MVKAVDFATSGSGCCPRAISELNALADCLSFKLSTRSSHKIRPICAVLGGEGGGGFTPAYYPRRRTHAPLSLKRGSVGCPAPPAGCGPARQEIPPCKVEIFRGAEFELASKQSRRTSSVSSSTPCTISCTYCQQELFRGRHPPPLLFNR